MVDLLGIYKKMEHQSRGRVGNFKTVLCSNHRQKMILKRKLVFFILRARVGHLEVSSLQCFFFMKLEDLFLFLKVNQNHNFPA